MDYRKGARNSLELVAKLFQTLAIAFLIGGFVKPILESPVTDTISTMVDEEKAGSLGVQTVSFEPTVNVNLLLIGLAFFCVAVLATFVATSYEDQ
ncbi:MAG: hypothetical protein ACU0GG_21820 [Paracoccaceae bacterium]